MATKEFIQIVENRLNTAIDKLVNDVLRMNHIFLNKLFVEFEYSVFETAANDVLCKVFKTYVSCKEKLTASRLLHEGRSCAEIKQLYLEGLEALQKEMDVYGTILDFETIIRNKSVKMFEKVQIELDASVGSVNTDSTRDIVEYFTNFLINLQELEPICMEQRIDEYILSIQTKLNNVVQCLTTSAVAHDRYQSLRTSQAAVGEHLMTKVYMLFDGIVKRVQRNAESRLVNVLQYYVVRIEKLV